MSTRPEGWEKIERPEGWHKAEKPEGWGKRVPSPTSTKVKHTAMHTEDAEQPVKQNQQAPKSADPPATDEAQNIPPTVPVQEEPQAQPILEQPKITDEAPCIQSDTKSAEPEKLTPVKPQEKKAKQPRQNKAAIKSEKKKAAPKKEKPACKKKMLIVLLVSLIVVAVVGSIVCWFMIRKGHDNENPQNGSEQSTTGPLPTAASPVSQPDTTEPPETLPDTTGLPETQPDSTEPPETQPDSTVPSESQPDPTSPSESQTEPTSPSEWEYRCVICSAILSTYPEKELGYCDNCQSLFRCQNCGQMRADVYEGYCMDCAPRAIICSVCGSDETYRGEYVILGNGTILCNACWEDIYWGQPNVWCPSCGYGFFTSGVGIEGLICPECGHNWLP